jgi:inorganic pyrophosphatase
MSAAFVVAYRGGCVMGFALTSLGLLVLTLIITLYTNLYIEDYEDYTSMYECIAGYGLGGSTIALFGRVGGGIFTKAADVGADLVGKVEEGMDEDSPSNPATIADNVGDNVGDIAGMGSDLFGSFAEATSAALVVASASPTFYY